MVHADNIPANLKVLKLLHGSCANTPYPTLINKDSITITDFQDHHDYTGLEWANAPMHVNSRAHAQPLISVMLYAATT